jgi:serine/threonine protein kinase
MTAELPTLTPELLAERAAIAFLEQFAADQAAGQHLPLAAYLQGSPLFHARIATEWLRATGQLAGTDGSDSHASSAAVNRVGPYRLLGELGRGGQGVVHLAEHSLLHRQVALKLLHGNFHAIDGSSRRRFRREAEIIAKLDHPGIATIYDYADDGQQAWIAMRFVAGGSLQQQLDAVRSASAAPWTAAEAAVIVERAAQALAVAHAHGILHRDIKPGNLLLDAANQPVLVDFGLAADNAQASAPWTGAGALFGTLNYLPPERLSGHPPDASGDIYGLGVVLFELLTLQRPFAAATTAQELRNAVSIPAPDVRSLRPQVPRDLALVVATALASDPHDRYQTAAALAEDLRRFRCRQPIAARPTPWHMRSLRLYQRNPGLTISLLRPCWC